MKGFQIFNGSVLMNLHENSTSPDFSLELPQN